MRLRILSIIFVAIIGIAVKAQTIVESGDGWSLDSDGLLMITKDMSFISSSQYPWYALSESVKSVVFGEGVTCVGSHAFYKCSGLTSVTIPESVMSIGSNAFLDCKDINELHLGSVDSYCNISFGNVSSSPLRSPSGEVKLYMGDDEVTSIVIPDGVTSINNYAFYGCAGLTSITIPESVTSIGDHAFYGCAGLTSITIPESVTSIGDYVFNGCSGLTSVIIPNGVASIGSHAFYKCSGLTSVTIPESVMSIGSNAFLDCKDINELHLGSVDSYYNISFGSNSSSPLFSASNEVKLYVGDDEVTSIVIPDDVTFINDYAFKNCSGLTSVTIPEGVTGIGDWAFFYCSGLTSVAIPSSVTSIGGKAFSGCSGLTCIEIPSSVVNIGNHAFESCKNINELYLGSVESYCKISFGNSNSSPLCSTTGEVKLYVGAEEVTEVVIPDGVTAINDCAFRNCSGLTSVTIPEGVESIGNYVFYGCSGLTSMTIPVGVTSIGSSAFSSCSGLTSVTIPESVISIGNGAFKRCSDIKELHIASVESWCNIDFGSVVFDAASKDIMLYVDEEEVTELVIPEGVTSIGDYAFHGCKYLTSMIISEGATNIGNHAFDSCSGLASVVIPSSVKSIGSYAFSKCNFTSLIIPEGVTSIGTYAFSECRCLTNVTIPEGVTNIGKSAFNGCNGLMGVTIPSSVTSIDSHTFMGCSSLISITIPKDVASIGDHAFKYCSGLTSVSILSTEDVTYEINATTGEYNTFENCKNLKYVFLYQNSTVQNLTKIFTTYATIERFFVPDDILSEYRDTYGDDENLKDKFTGFSMIEKEEAGGEDEETVALTLDKGSYGFITWAVNSGEQVRDGEEISIALTEDFDMAADDVTWQTLGTADHPFKGIFEGNGHTVTLGGEKLEGNVDNAMFGVISEEASVKNIQMLNVYADYAEASDIKSTDGKKTYYALLAKENNGVIQNCVVKGSVADMNDETAVACLVADNYGTIDHCVAYFTNLTAEADDASNKRKIIVMQNVGVGRTAGTIIKTASNGKKKATSKAVTLSSAPKFSTDDINSDYRIYSDEEMATGEPAYWMNMEGQGYTGTYTGKWSMSSDGLFPVLADASHKKVVKVDYEVEGLSASAIADLSLDGTSFAKVGAVATVSYDQQPSVIDGVLATMEDASAQFTVPEPDENGIVTVTLKYASLTTEINAESVMSAKVAVTGRNITFSDVEGDVMVTDVMGRQVYSRKDKSDNVTFRLPSAGIYIVKAGDVVEKVVVR